jgi:hypothetical protein
MIPGCPACSGPRLLRCGDRGTEPRDGDVRPRTRRSGMPFGAAGCRPQGAARRILPRLGELGKLRPFAARWGAGRQQDDLPPPAALLPQVFCLDQSVTSVGASGQTREGAELAVWFGGASMAGWLCCPFWILVSFVSLPLALVGLVRACVEYHASRSGRASRLRAVIGAVLSLLGATAAITYMIFLANHPDLPAQE